MGEEYALLLNQNQHASLKVYPNPSNGTFTVTSPKRGMQMRIFNAQGIEVPITTENGQVKISPSGQGAVYFLHTVVAGKTKITKIIRVTKPFH